VPTKPTKPAKPAARKPVPAAPPRPPRGVALVEKVIAAVQDAGGTLAGCGLPEEQATPLTPAQLDALRLPGDRPLPPSLRRWLAYDARWIGLFADLRKPVLRPMSLSALVAQELDEAWGEVCAAFEELIPAPCLLLPLGADSRRFLYLGEPDELGEYPVLVVDTDDVAYICVEAAGFDLYLADAFDVSAPGANAQAAIADQARRNCKGFISIGLGGDLEHVDGDAAGEALIAELGFGEDPDA
jgi:hypothetical protein